MTIITKEIGTQETPTMLSAAAVDGTAPRPARRGQDSEAAPVASAPRKRRTNLGGASLKLEVTTTIAGCHLYWENDIEARLERLLAEGFDFVSPSEVGMHNVTGRIVADTDVTDRVSKYVGTTEEGKPMRAYLMKCPDDIWEDIQDCISDLADSRDRDILDSANRATGDRYKPSGYDTKVSSGRR